MAKGLAILAISLLQLLSGIKSENVGEYTIIAPGTLHSANKYHVAVAVHDTTEACQLKVGIVGEKYKDEQVVDISAADDVKLLEFNVPELEKGDYNLTAEGLKGLAFKNTTKLNFEQFQPHVLIQTDKGVYKPGDTVQFRVLFLDENLRPIQAQKGVKVWFEDNKKNRIKEFNNIDIVRGVYTDKFQLSDYAPLGFWRLLVQTDEQRVNKQVGFEVEKYVLPKFVMKVEATDRVSMKDGDVQAVVRANYTFGKPFNGKATIIVKAHNNNWYSDEQKPEKHEDIPAIIKSTDIVNGKAKFDFNVKHFQAGLHKKYASRATITATAEEEFTGVKLNDTVSITLFPNRYEMSCISYDTCGLYHADEEQEVIIQVHYIDGTPLKDTKSVLRLTYTETYRDTRWHHDTETTTVSAVTVPPPEKLQRFTFESHLNESSLAVFKVKLPDLAEIEDYQHYFVAELEYLDEKDEILSSYQFRKPKQVTPEPEEDKEPKEYFKLEPEFEKDKYSVKLGAEAVINVNSSEPLTYFVYTIVARGNVLKASRIDLPEPAKLYKLKIPTTFAMAPRCAVYAHYVKDGEYKYAEATLYMDWEFENQLNITAPAEVKPGQNVELNITTTPHSFVGLLGIDQSVLLLRENNDIHKNNVRYRLGHYTTYTPYQGGYSYYPGSQSGVVTLTNAKYFYNYTKPEYFFSSTPFSSVQFSDESIGLRRTYFKGGAAVGGLGAVPALASDTVAMGSAAQPTVRKDFAETWIFANIEDTQEPSFTWAKKIPDTITSWLISGFSLHPEKGLATTNDRTNIKTFQPFFVTVRLPYSVKRGETINIPVLVFNYLDKDLDVEVTLDNSDNEYEFTEVTNEVLDIEQRSKTVRVPANSAKGASFMIRPKVIGNIMLKLKAISPLAGDAIHKTLKVVPEGITEYANRAYLVNLKDAAATYEETFKLELPADIVPDSEHAEFAVVGDLLAPLLNNLDNLVRLPAGCGEQTMSTMVPNYLMLHYLKSINRLTPALTSRIVSNLERGYQNMLRFQHEDGSFSSFGPKTYKDEKPRNGSTWLTAYVLRFLQKSAEHINIDDKVITDGLAYLISKQAENGSFVESEDFFYHSQQNELSRTAHVLLALEVNKTKSADFTTQIEKANKFLLDQLPQEKSLLAKAQTVYTLKQSQHPEAAAKLAELDALAKTDAERKWWTAEEEQVLHTDDLWRWWRWPRSNEVETTSYILLSMLEQEQVDEQQVLPIIKWLVSQRNSYGGFASTQDTVVGLQALIMFAEKTGYKAADMTVDFKSKGEGREKYDKIKLNEENGILLQSFELPEKTRTVDFMAQGQGAALVQVSYQYNIYEKEKSPSFAIKTVRNENTPAHKLELQVCVDYTGEAGGSNMAIAEISLPSGYVTDEDSLEDIRQVDRVRQVDTKNAETTIVVYFESLLKNDMKCLPVLAYKAHAVANQKPAPIVVYDYYDTNQRASSSYQIISKICDICDKEEEECQKQCA